MIKKAKDELLKENSYEALRYFQKAFEVSLPDEFFLADRDIAFSMITVSADRSKALLLEKEKTKKNENIFWIIDLKDKDELKEKIKGKVYYTVLSPKGRYALFSIFSQNKKIDIPKDIPKESDEESDEEFIEEENCAIWIWDNQKEIFIPTADLLLNCYQKPAVSEEGIVLFILNEKISAYDINKNPFVYQFVEEEPVPPVKKLNNIGSFFFSTNNNPYFLYGVFGRYDFYAIIDKKIKKITNEASFSHVFFLGQDEVPGVFLGGASEHKMVFYKISDQVEIDFQFPIKEWKNGAFISRDHYFYLMGSRLIEKKNDKEKEMPFWGSQIYAGLQNELCFLSPLGTALIYKGNIPDPKSVLIFEKGWELDESDK
ncbi:MAG: hypothetical protein OEZ22_05935 [Spirochaetia bacterium]|nr:hypothetical protein [Spirochaetia bacterium]